MTQALRTASQEAEASRAELQAQGEYLETVLGNLSSGVLTLDGEGRIITANESCKQILRLPETFGSGTTGSKVERSLERLAEFDPA